MRLSEVPEGFLVDFYKFLFSEISREFFLEDFLWGRIFLENFYRVFKKFSRNFEASSISGTIYHDPKIEKNFLANFWKDTPPRVKIMRKIDFQRFHENHNRTHKNWFFEIFLFKKWRFLHKNSFLLCWRCLENAKNRFFRIIFTIWRHFMAYSGILWHFLFFLLPTL